MRWYAHPARRSRAGQKSKGEGKDKKKDRKKIDTQILEKKIEMLKNMTTTMNHFIVMDSKFLIFIVF